MAYKIHIEKQGKPYPYDYDYIGGSLPEDLKISTKIKPIEKSNANSEIEKGEIVLDPDTGALHKALGKPHSKGGTPVSLKDKSFIFSNYKSLSISKNEKELFEFKMGGKYKSENSTPSKVLEKEINLEHHNKMIDILNKEKENTKESVNSAKLMMMKNLEKAGQIAFLQESKKENQIPIFSTGTAPVYSKQVDDQINRSMQYLQLGGKKLSDEDILKAEQNLLKDLKGWNFVFKNGTKSYYNQTGSFQRKKPTPEEEAAYAKYLANETPEQKIKRKAREASQKYQNLGYTVDSINRPEVNEINLPNFNNIPSPPTFKPKSFDLPKSGNLAGDVDGIIDPTTYNTKLTPWQKINIGIPFYRALNVKTQYPLRQHQESVIPQLENINVQPQLDSNNQAYFNSAMFGKTMPVNQGIAFQQQLFGNRIAANNQAIGNIQQTNVNTQNQQKAMVADTLNRDAIQNKAFDLKYYDQVQTAIKNTDELKQAYTQQGINNLNDTITRKLAFDSWLNSQQQYRGNPTYIDKDGVQHYKGQSLYSPKPNFFGYSVGYNAPNIDWSTYQGTGNKVDSAQELGQAYLQAKQFDETLKFADFLKFKGLSNYNTNANNIPQTLPPSFKMGGKYRSKK